MALQKPMSNRKAASSFISDGTEMNLIQLSPVKNAEQNSISYSIINQCSRTNFIGSSIIPIEGPRAFAISKTGEKHSVDICDSPMPKISSNTFTISSPMITEPSMERISEKSSSQLSLTEKANKSSSRLGKMPHCRYIKQKSRLSCTPRNGRIGSSSRLLIPNPKRDEISTKLVLNANTETQTDDNSSLAFVRAAGPKSFNFTATADGMNYLPTEANRNFFKEAITNQQKFYGTAALPPSEPLKIYTRTNNNLRKYSELRGLASALTLITVVSWLFSTFLDVECLWDYMDGFWQHIRNWFLPEEKPKTKVEILVTFLQEFWS